MLQRSLIPQNNSLAKAIGLFKKELATLTKILGVRFTPKYFWKNTETTFYRNFIVPCFFCAICYFNTSAHELQTQTTDKAFHMVPNTVNMRRSNIETQNSDILLLVRYNVSFLFLSVQKQRNTLQKWSFPAQNLIGKNTFVQNCS